MVKIFALTLALLIGVPSAMADDWAASLAKNPPGEPPCEEKCRAWIDAHPTRVDLLGTNDSDARLRDMQRQIDDLKIDAQGQLIDDAIRDQHELFRK